MPVWPVVETAGFETAWIALDGLAVDATGRRAGLRPRVLAADEHDADPAACDRSGLVVDYPTMACRIDP
jgi:hypothetical protein